MPVIMYSERVQVPNPSGFSGNSREVNTRQRARALNGLVLEPFYYLKNFELVLATISSRYSDLLTDNELRFVTQFRDLPMLSRALLTRMVMRRGDLFRASKLNYAEIGEASRATAALVEAGWVSDRPLLKFEQLHGLLTKEELIRCLRLPSRYVKWRKAELQVMLRAQYPERRCFDDWYPGGYANGDCVYALLIQRMCERFRLMFFGNDVQSWTEFVTADLGVLRYEKVEGLQSRPFQTRSHIEAFQRIQECRELLAQGMPLDELTRIMPVAILDNEWLEERRQKLLFLIAREHERGGEDATASSLYLQCSYRGARSRAIRLKVKSKEWEEARVLCALAKENPDSEAELQHVRRVLPRIHRNLKLAYAAEHATPVVPEFEIVLSGEHGGAVEYRVRDHLARDLVDCSTVRYVENGLITALFGLLCWPAIFAPVAGAFFHDFQRGPVDLESGHFYRRRKADFDRCLSHLESGDYRKHTWRVFREKRGVTSPFVSWHQVDEALLSWALACFPKEHLKLWFEWILRDCRENRAGFPDLVQFWPEEARYRLIEVKAPGDRLQDNQKRLLEYCVSHGMPVSVCWVKWESGGPIARQ